MTLSLADAAGLALGVYLLGTGFGVVFGAYLERACRRRGG